MLTEAEILSIDYTSNVCEVRIPLFETVNTLFPSRVTAVFACPPGIYNGFKNGDFVWVAFEANKPEKPVVIGKIYRGISAENEAGGSTVNCVDLNVTNSANLPATTKITNASNKYDSLKKIIDKVNTLVAKQTERHLLTIRCATNSAGDATAALELYVTTNTKYENTFGINLFKTNLLAAGFKVELINNQLIFSDGFPMTTSDGKYALLNVRSDTKDLYITIDHVPAKVTEVTYFHCTNITNI